MKKATLTFALITIICNAFAQTIVKEIFYSGELKDTIKYRVWLPEDYNIKDKYAVIYTVEDKEDGLLAGVVNVYSRFFPKSIVVGIVNGRSLINYDFSTGMLNAKGPEFVNCLSNEIMPNVEKKYNTSIYKVFMGHSYSASYANYLFLHKQGMFSSYILFAPERWWIDEHKPPFELDAATIKYYNTHNTFYYIASGGKDELRRRTYAKEIAEKVKQLDTNQFVFQYQSIADDDHLSIVPNNMAAALQHIFKPYYSYKFADSVADPLAFFNKTKKQLNDIYGLMIEKNNSNISTFANLASKSKDKKAMDAFADYFLDENTNGVDLRNFAYSCIKMGYAEKAKEVYEQCIAKSKKDELKTVQGPLNLVMAYRELAYKVYKDDTPKAWETLLKALNDADVKDSLMMHYYIGKLAVDKTYKSEVGLQHLLLYAKSSLSQGARWGVFPETVYCYIGKCYLLLNDKPNSKAYLQKALTENPDNKEAKELLQKM